ncbi:MAG: type II toxin-antitoxin system RelE/ParE family toxin [Verrucomicrobiota bacterium]|jgi:mRNA interferase RelE/StbE
MSYRVEIGSRADAQLAEIDSTIGASVERKILWLAENAAVMVHRRLVGMPDDLAGLCKLRVGDWRILYWVYHREEIVRIYRIQHRSEVYRDL